MASVFTQIINRELPAHILYEDEHVIVFLDIFPTAVGHTLVVPKSEKQNMMESSQDDLQHVLRVAREIAPNIVQAVGADGFVFSTNIGEAAGQSVFHTHFHIIPRFENDDLKGWPQKQGDQDELAALAEKITSAL